MYRIGICDDEPVFLETIKSMTGEILTGMGVEYDILTFRHTRELEKHLRAPSASLDLLLLDILMGEQNGLVFAEQLRMSGSRLPIIFVTSTMDFALEGYKVEPLGYLMKPVQRAELKDAIIRARHRYQSRTVMLQSPSHSVSFSLDQVLYLDIRNKDLAVHLADGSILTISVPLNSLISRLPPEQFVRCYRSYIVSMPAIISIWRYGIELKNHETIPVSRSYYAAVQNALLNWVSLT